MRKFNIPYCLYCLMVLAMSYYYIFEFFVGKQITHTYGLIFLPALAVLIPMVNAKMISFPTMGLILALPLAAPAVVWVWMGDKVPGNPVLGVLAHVGLAIFPFFFWKRPKSEA